MKKTLLLFCALGAMAASAEAQSFGDFYNVTFKGAPVTDGQTINVTENIFESYEDGGETYQSWSFESVDFMVEAVGDENRALKGSLIPIVPANKDMFFAGGASASLCYRNSPVLGGSCTISGTYDLGDGVVNVGPTGWVDNGPFGSGTPFQWNIHYSVEGVEGSVNASDIRQVDLVMTACEGSIEARDGEGTVNNYEIIEPTLTIHVCYTSDASSVATLEADSAAPVRYFSLDGRELREAPSGMYIELRGNRAIKRLAR